jgi:hypothetical protein
MFDPIFELTVAALRKSRKYYVEALARIRAAFCWSISYGLADAEFMI